MFSENLRRFRQERNMSQTDLSNFCGISKTMISNYEKGKNIPKGRSLEKLMSSLNLSKDELFGENDINNKNNSKKHKDKSEFKTSHKNSLKEILKTSSNVKDRFMEIVPCKQGERCNFCNTKENVSKINIGTNSHDNNCIYLCNIHQKRLVKKLVSHI